MKRETYKLAIEDESYSSISRESFRKHYLKREYFYCLCCHEDGRMESFMKKEMIEKTGLKIVGKMAKKLCVVNANSTCWYLAGQDVPPQELKKLRKK